MRWNGSSARSLKPFTFQLYSSGTQSPHPCSGIRDLHVSVERTLVPVKGRSGFSALILFADNGKWLAFAFCVLFAKGEEKSTSTNIWLCVCVYLAVQFFHSDEVQRLEGVACWGDEIKANVDPGVVVVKQRALDLQLLLEIVFKLSVDVVDDGLVAVKKKDKEKTVRIYDFG